MKKPREFHHELYEARMEIITSILSLIKGTDNTINLDCQFEIEDDCGSYYKTFTKAMEKDGTICFVDEEEYEYSFGDFSLETLANIYEEVYYNLNKE